MAVPPVAIPWLARESGTGTDAGAYDLVAAGRPCPPSPGPRIGVRGSRMTGNSAFLADHPTDEMLSRVNAGCHSSQIVRSGGMPSLALKATPGPRFPCRAQ